MLYSSPHNVFSDLNYFFAPFCIPKLIESDKNKNCNAGRRENSNINYDNISQQNNIFNYSIWPNQFMTILHPKTVKIKIVNNDIETSHSKEVNHDKVEKNKNIFLVLTNHDLNDSTLENTMDNISLSNGEITKFNTDPKLKKNTLNLSFKKKN